MRPSIASILAVVLIFAASSGCGGCGDPPVDSGDGGHGDAGPDAGNPTGRTADPGNLDNPNLDADCDGLNDAEEFATVYPGGGQTHPENPDTDGDGILDGVERGRMRSVDPLCAGFTGDADPATATNPVNTDTDGDDLPDGLEDASRNGRLDSGETDPAIADTDRDGLSDGSEDASRNGRFDPDETDPRQRDTDGDGISDGIERTRTRTDPTLPDTDGDGCLDGREDSNQNGVVDPGESNPRQAGDCRGSVADTDGDGLLDVIEDSNFNDLYEPARGETDFRSADTDGDGLPDGLEDRNHNGSVDSGETDPRRRDTDCDGLLDGPDQPASGLRGEDRNASGGVDPDESDPLRADSDGDLLLDGVERGVTINLDPGRCPTFAPAATPTNPTDPLRADTDGDGIADGVEDGNHNGRLDAGETDPNVPQPPGDPSVTACATANLRPVVFAEQGQPDIVLGLPSTFTELTPIELGGARRGLMGYDSSNKVAFLVYRQAAPGGASNPTADEAALRPMVESAGGLSSIITQTFTTWDGFPALQALYDQPGTRDIKAQANALAGALVGAGAGSLTGAAGASGPFKLQAEYVHRSNSAVVVLIALSSAALFPSEPTIFSVGDTAGGSALASFGNTHGIACERFQPTKAAVDFLLVVDDSGSMAGSQAALANAAAALEASLANAYLDWRIAEVNSDYHVAGSSNSGVLRQFTRNIRSFKAWLTQDSSCSAGSCSLVPAPAPCNPTGGSYGGCWVGTRGTGAEGLLGAARNAVDDLTPGTASEQPDRMRAGATLVVILLGDADDQTSGYTSTSHECSAAAPCEPASDFTQFFLATGSTPLTRNKLNQAITVHGIICPAGHSCNSEYEASPQRHAQVLTATGGIRGDIRSSASIDAAVNQIIRSTITSLGHRLSKPPIGASIKVVLDSVRNPGSGPGQCNPRDIPRSTANGFDYNGQYRTLSFYGACRPPDGATASAAASYRYWLPTTPPPPSNPPCYDDPYYDASEADHCRGKLFCNTSTNICECPQGCGGTPPPGTVCDANRAVCDFVCTPDCGGRCTAFQACNTTTCGCQCATNTTCPPGYVFSDGEEFCGCVCDTTALDCGPTHTPDPATCTCACKPDCGGCSVGAVCNPSTCRCQDTIG